MIKSFRMRSNLFFFLVNYVMSHLYSIIASLGWEKWLYRLDTKDPSTKGTMKDDWKQWKKWWSQLLDVFAEKVEEDKIIAVQKWGGPTVSGNATCGSADNAPLIHSSIIWFFNNSEESFSHFWFNKRKILVMM